MLKRGRQSLFPSCFWFITQFPARGGNVRLRGTHITGARRLETRLQPLAGQTVQINDQLEQRDGLPRCNVEDFARRALRRRFGGNQIGGNRVADKREVARLPAIAKNHRRFSPQHPGAEPGNDPGIGRRECLARTENVEVAQGDGLQTIEAMKELRVFLAGVFLQSIGRQRIRRQPARFLHRCLE